MNDPDYLLTTIFGESNQQAFVAISPGRVNLIGGHTDYNEGFVLPAAIGQYVNVAARPRTDKTVAAYSEEYDEIREFSLEDADPDAKGSWIDYVEGVCTQLAQDHALRGAEFVVRSDLPSGAGLSSSAALELAVAAAVDRMNDLECSNRTLARHCWRAENEFVGVNCGIMDQYAVALSAENSALFLDCRDEAVEHIPFPAETVNAVVINTTVTHELVESAYNERRAQCERGVALFDRCLDREVTSLRDISIDDFEAYQERLPAPVRERCEHVVYENRRVQRAVDALREGEIETVGDLMYDSHASLRDLYEVSCEELDVAVDVARTQDDVLGARMTGAGFGGSVIGLVRAQNSGDAVNAIRREFRSRTDVDPQVAVYSLVKGVQAN